MTNYEGRNKDLKNRINTHLTKLTGERVDFYSKMTQLDFIELKTVLADIHNVLTFKTTISAANWLNKCFKFDKKLRTEILATIDKTKPNTKGFDILISEPYKIIAEVKCISPVNNGETFGAAQWNSILDDFHKLKNGKGSLSDTSNYYKFVFLLDLGDRTDQAITKLLKTSKATSNNPLRENRHKIKEHICLLSDKDKMENLNFEKIYLKTIQLDK